VKNITEEASKLVHLSTKKKVNNLVEIEEVLVVIEVVMVIEVVIEVEIEEVSKDKITEKLILKKFL